MHHRNPRGARRVPHARTGGFPADASAFDRARPALPARDGTFVFPASPERFPSFATRETAPGDDFAAEPLLAPRAPLLFSYCSASVGALCRAAAAAAAARVSSAAFAAAARTAATVFPGLARSAASAAARLAAAAARVSVPGGDLDVARETRDTGGDNSDSAGV